MQTSSRIAYAQPLDTPCNGYIRPSADAAEAVARRGRSRVRFGQDVQRVRERNVLDRCAA